MNNKQPLMKTKPKWITLLSLLLCVLTVSGALASGVLAADFGVIHNTDTLNLRADASSSSRLLGTYQKGTWVYITGSKNNFFYVTTPDGRQGYMSKNYITQGTQSPSEIAVVDNTGGGRFLNFRQYPDLNAKVLGIFYDGVPLYVLGTQGGWVNVQINGQIGYVSGNYVRTLHGLASPTVATIKTPNNTAINLRSGPGSGYSVLRQFPGDRYVMVLLQGNGWWKVSIDGYVGFMSSDFLAEGLKAAKDIAADNPSGPGYAVVSNPKSTQTLNLRAFPSASAQVLAKLYNGTKAIVTQQGLEWCAVSFPETTLSGYVMTAYLQLHNLPKTPSLKVYHPQGQRVNLRTGPSFEAKVTTQVPSGKTVTVLAPGVDWTKVQYGNSIGYMVTYFLQ